MKGQDGTDKSGPRPSPTGATAVAA